VKDSWVGEEEEEVGDEELELIREMVGLGAWFDWAEKMNEFWPLFGFGLLRCCCWWWWWYMAGEWLTMMWFGEWWVCCWASAWFVWWLLL